MSNYQTVSTTGMFGKHSYSVTHAQCLPSHCDSLATASVLGPLDVPNDTACLHTSLARLSRINQPWERKKSQFDKHW
jgi:hypothetical protein